MLIKVSRFFTKSKLLKDLKALNKTTSSNSNKISVSPNVQVYEKIFNKFKKNIRAGETYQIKIAQKYSNKKDLDIVNLFFNLMKKNLSPESFCVRTNDFNRGEDRINKLINSKKTVQRFNLLCRR